MNNQRIKKPYLMNSDRPSQGFSLVEMMLSMLIGSIILAGIFTIFANTRESQRTMDQHLVMIGDARFAIELLTFDLRHASIYGGTNLATIIEGRSEDTSWDPEAPAIECTNSTDGWAGGWTYDMDLPVYSPSSADEITNYKTGCPLISHVANTDIIVVRYADTTPVTSLEAGVAYVRSNYKAGKLFEGMSFGDFSGDTLDAFTQNYRYIARAYYISSYTDTVGDNIPSLRRLELESEFGNPVLTDQVLMPGVEDLQIQFGIDTDNDGEINKYVNAVNVSAQSVTDSDPDNRAEAKSDWSKIKAIKIWALIRAEKKEKDLNTASASTSGVAGYNLGGFFRPDSSLNDGYRRLLFSNVIRTRNMEYDALITPTSTASP